MVKSFRGQALHSRRNPSNSKTSSDQYLLQLLVFQSLARHWRRQLFRHAVSRLIEGRRGERPWWTLPAILTAQLNKFTTCATWLDTLPLHELC